MTAFPSEDAAALSGQVLLYSQPEPLDPERHGRLGMKNTRFPFAFAAKQHFVPLQIGEFGFAAVNYPILFAGENRAPLAVLGLHPGENLFIDDHGAYRVGAYVPSFLRRYPFVAAHDQQNDRMIVCIDRAADIWTEDEPDMMLFEDGKPTSLTTSCIDFCSQFDADRVRTESFVALMNDLDLFESKQTSYTPRRTDGVAMEPVMVAEYFAVSETKLNALSHNKLSQLRDNGALAQVYAHLTSLYGWDRVIAESIVRANATTPAAGNA